MFVYNKASRPISVRLQGCAYQSHQIDTREKIFFIFDLLGEHEGVLIVETYDKASMRFEKIESTAELRLASSAASPLDYYELPD